MSRTATPFDIISPDSSIPPLCQRFVAVPWAWLFLSVAPMAQRSDTMLAVNRTAGTVQQLVEFAAHLRQMLQWTERPSLASPKAPALTPSLNVSHDHLKSPSNTEKGAHGQTITNSTTFCAQWGGRTCYLGDTLPFWFLERLARRPNQLFRYDTLLQDVWKCKRSKEALRSVVKVLRQKLKAADMDDLAEAIDGALPIITA